MFVLRVSKLAEMLCNYIRSLNKLIDILRASAYFWCKDLKAYIKRKGDYGQRWKSKSIYCHTNVNDVIENIVESIDVAQQY